VKISTDRPCLRANKIGRRNPRMGGWLIEDVSFAINLGERIAVSGPSGAGKTVLLRAIARLDRLDAGSIEWLGKDIRGSAVPAYRRQVMYLHQRPALFDGSVEDNLRLPFSLGAYQASAFERERATDLFVNLGRDPNFLEKSSRDLSGGEGQLVALVRAMLLEPTVLLLDEATASLDPATARAFEDVLDRWLGARPADRSLLWVSHDHDQALRMTRRQITLASGRIVAEE
jgi:putative ABC transport system ATP-binding protein